jgi:hypothetical protein
MKRHELLPVAGYPQIPATVLRAVADTPIRNADFNWALDQKGLSGGVRFYVSSRTNGLEYPALVN